MADYLTILENPPRPPLISSIVRGARKMYAFLTSAGVAVFGAVLQLMGVTVLGKIFLGLGVLSVAITLLLSVAIFATAWWQYIRQLRDAFDGVRRKMLLHAEWQEDAPAPALRIPMLQVAFDEGSATMRIIVAVAPGVGLRVGSRLALIFTATNEVWGVLQINSLHVGYAWAIPHDRRKAEFWKALEDRAKIDPSVPEGFHLEADIPEFMRYEPVS